MVNIADLTVLVLKAELRARSLPVTGLKAELAKRLSDYLLSHQDDPTNFTLIAEEDDVLPDASAAVGKPLLLDIPPPKSFEVLGDVSVATRWLKWKRGFEYYLSAMGDVSDEKKKNLLLYVAGFEVQEICSTFAPSKCDTYDSVIKSLNEHFDPKKNKRYERFKFRQTSQLGSESMDNYVVRLKKLGESCDFADLEDNVLDQIIEKGIDIRLRRRLLEYGDLLTLEKALELARAMEQTEKQIKRIEKRDNLDFEVDTVSARGRSRARSRYASSNMRHHSGARRSSSRGHVGSVPNRASSGTHGQQMGNRCFRCGSLDHFANDVSCRACHLTCNFCSKRGHVASVCQRKQRMNRPTNTHSIESKEPDDTVVFVSSVNMTKAMLPITVKLGKTQKQLLGLLDSGSSFCLLPLSMLKENFRSYSLQPSTIQLRNFSGHAIPVVGSLSADISVDGQSVPVEFIVTESGIIFSLAWI